MKLPTTPPRISQGEPASPAASVRQTSAPGIPGAESAQPLRSAPLEGGRLRILLSAYACEPNRGSEPAVGWEWATRLAKFHDVTVLTRANNQPVIEAVIGGEWQPGQPRFIYHDLPKWLVLLKRKGVCPVNLYYLLWQLAASFKLRAQMDAFDVVHHVTFNGFRFPGAWWFHRVPVVLGPLGGGSVASPQFKRCFGLRWAREKLRELSVTHWNWNPWTIASMKRAASVLVVGGDLQECFRHSGVEAQLMFETALPSALEAGPEIVPIAQKRDFVLVGALEPWKAWQIALEAYALAVSKGVTRAKLRIVGSGSQAQMAAQTARSLGVAERVEFVSHIPRNEVWEMVVSSRALIFSSIRDTSGNVVLEAMGLRCPVICFKHQGVEIMTDDLCAFRIAPSSWRESVEGFANSMVALEQDDKMVEAMGNAGRERVMKEFTWDAKVAAMLKIYSKCQHA